MNERKTEDMKRNMEQNELSIEFPFVEGRQRLQADDIIYIETFRHKNLFVTQKQIYSIYKKLDEIQQQLDGMGFVRAHRSFLVNMQYIEKISSYIMTLTTGKEISVPKARYQEVKRIYQTYISRKEVIQ